MVPVGERGHEDPLEVGEDGLERLAVFRGLARQRATDVAGRDARQHRVALGAREVFGDPVDQRVAVPPEFGWIHVNCEAPTGL